MSETLATLSIICGVAFATSNNIWAFFGMFALFIAALMSSN